MSSILWVGFRKLAEGLNRTNKSASPNQEGILWHTSFGLELECPFSWFLGLLTYPGFELCNLLKLVSQFLIIKLLMATHSSILTWRILWTEEPGRLQSMGSKRVGHDWVTSLSSIYAHLIDIFSLENPE